ncbi:MAG: helix-turn-helix transcriptional regulator [bacterium]|nr:helix-turn-helix transcriptional regulator [bacterium]
MTTERTPDSEVGKILRRNIDRLLADRGWTPKILYAALGMAPSSYSLMFKNQGGAKTRELIRIAKALGCTTAELTQ